MKSRASVRNLRYSGRQARLTPRNRVCQLEQLEDRRVLALLGVQPEAPVVFYDNQGTVTFDAGTQEFSVQASPTIFAGTTQGLFSDPRGLSIRIQVDGSGNLIGGVPGDDLVLTGNLDIDGNGTVDFSGVLLTGEVSGFGFLNVGGTDRALPTNMTFNSR